MVGLDIIAPSLYWGGGKHLYSKVDMMVMQKKQVKMVVAFQQSMYACIH